jgi:hypothetical protein
MVTSYLLSAVDFTLTNHNVDNTFAQAIDNQGGTGAPGAGDSCFIIATTSGFSSGVAPIYSEINVHFQDNDAADWVDTDEFVPRGTGPGHTDNAWEANAANTLTIGFWCQKAYKVMGIYDEDDVTATGWIDTFQYDVDEDMDWNFRTTVPNGASTQTVRSGAPASAEGTNDYCLGIQWFLPDVLAADLTVSMLADFVNTDPDITDVIVDDACDWAWGVDATPAGEINHVAGTYNGVYNPVIDSGAFTGEPVGASVTINGGGVDIGQYDVVFIYYTVDIPAIFADGTYETNYGCSVV